MDKTGDDCRILAAHVYGGPFTVWGAGFGVGLGNPYNASGYNGISFWARSAVPLTLQIAFPDKDTAVAGGLAIPARPVAMAVTTTTRLVVPSAPNGRRLRLLTMSSRSSGSGVAERASILPDALRNPISHSARREIRRLGR